MSRVLKLVVSCALTGILLYLLVSFSDLTFSTLKETFSNISFLAIFLAFLAYSLMNLCRAFRLKLLFPDLSIRIILSITLIHNFVNNILPFRLGELSYTYLIRRERSYSHAFSSLLFIRMMDMLSLSFLFACALIFMPNHHENLKPFGFVVALLILIVLSVFFILNHTSLISMKALNKFREIFRSYSWGTGIGTFMISNIMWLLSFYVYYIIIKELSMNISYIEIIMPCALLILSTILPVTGIAGFGTMEAAWVFGMALYGIPEDVALASGLIIHFIRIGFIIILGTGGGALIYNVDNNTPCRDEL